MIAIRMYASVRMSSARLSSSSLTGLKDQVARWEQSRYNHRYQRDEQFPGRRIATLSALGDARAERHITITY